MPARLFAMRTLAAFVLFCVGLIAIAGTVVMLFPNSEGVLDLSPFEGVFLVQYGMAVHRTFQRYRALGQGVLRTVHRVVNSAGICALIPLALLAIGIASSGHDRASNLSSDQSVVMAQLQNLWLGFLLSAAYFSAPRLPKTMPLADSPAIKPVAENQQLEPKVKARN